jgi:hypothetical protein
MDNFINKRRTLCSNLRVLEGEWRKYRSEIYTLYNALIQNHESFYFLQYAVITYLRKSSLYDKCKTEKNIDTKLYLIAVYCIALSRETNMIQKLIYTDCLKIKSWK